MAHLKAKMTKFPTDEMVAKQAKRLYRKGFGNGRTLAEYLAAIPQIPERLLVGDPRFPDLILVDARYSIEKLCFLAGIAISHGCHRALGPDIGSNEAYWIRAQNGRKNDYKPAAACCASFDADERGLSVHEGLAYYIQHRKQLDGYAMAFPTATLHVDGRNILYLECLNSCPELDYLSEDVGYLRCGSASRLQ